MFRTGRRSWARRLERLCCNTLAYFPLAFVYSLHTWAVWVQVGLGFMPESEGKISGVTTSVLGFVLYVLAVWSYSVAVFRSPGSPSDPIPTWSTAAGYTSLPTSEPAFPASKVYRSFTTKSTGKPRYCKKCHVVKPDRTHHCSTCNRCVLKMDHHCPWLATCVGLRNYKAFILFLTYTSLFCCVCFATTCQWTMATIFDDTRLDEGLGLVNVILLAVLSGIIGLVLGGFTAWHLYLACTNQTTIESLEKTRYLSPLKKSMEQQYRAQQHRGGGGGDEENPSAPADSDADSDSDGRTAHHATLGSQLKQIHANALPSITRPEEGEETSSSTPTRPSAASPAQESLRHTYAHLEAQRERDRYSAYLDELDSEKLPHAFNLGVRRNLLHLFGPSPLLWFLPVCNTLGDGWNWEASDAWLRRRDEVARERTAKDEAEIRRQQQAGWGGGYLPGFGPPAPAPAPLQQQQQQQQQQYPPASVAAGAGRHYTSPQVPREPHRPDVPAPSWAQAQHDSEDADDELGVNGRYLTTTNGVVQVPRAGRRSPSKIDQILGRGAGGGHGAPAPPAARGRRWEGEYGYESSTSSSDDDEEEEEEVDEDDRPLAQLLPKKGSAFVGGARAGAGAGGDWNDIPDDMFTPNARRGNGSSGPAPKAKGSSSRGRAKDD